MNAVYQGEYSLNRWVELIENKNIILPPYQRSFVWDKNKSKEFINSLINEMYVPPIIIGAYKDSNGFLKNYILDGQQRLSSIILAKYNIFPNVDMFKYTKEDDMIDENDDEADCDNFIMDWTLNYLYSDNKNYKNLRDSKYYEQNIYVSDDDFKMFIDKFDKLYLGFNYLVPDNKTDCNEYFSQTFRSINYLGIGLKADESRKALYFLKSDKDKYFMPNFLQYYKISKNRIDFVRYMSFLSQYVKNDNKTDGLAYGYGRKLEKYYEEYIYAIANDNESDIFYNIHNSISDEEFNCRIDYLDKILTGFYKRKFDTIIEMDICIFGLIYYIVFVGKKKISIDSDILNNNNIKNKHLFQDIDIILKGISDSHKKTPSSVKYIKERINQSIKVYEKYI